MKKSGRLVRKDGRQVCMTLTGDAEVFIPDIQALGALLLVTESLVVLVFLGAARLLEVPGQGPLKGSVFACVPFMTVF
jgi:hypothetical protein